jgi:LysR family transcriptional regulator, transcriptional activator of nhaA
LHKKRICGLINSNFWSYSGITLMRDQRLNYKHLHYFWVIARSGGVARAGEKLHLSPQALSTQMRQLEAAVGEPLWRRAGRKLELTEAGHLVMEYADRLFSVGEELQDALAQRQGHGQHKALHVGLTGSVVKVVSWRLLEPVLALPEPPRLFCREGRLPELLALLGTRELDVVLSDRPMPQQSGGRSFNHLLVECGISFLARPQIAKPLVRGFPYSLAKAPMLMPSGDSALRVQLLRWFENLDIQPQIVAEFDDTALMKTFGQGGVGVFPMPNVVSKETQDQFKVVPVGISDDVLHRVYAITGERYLSNPALVTISETAHRNAWAKAAPKTAARLRAAAMPR